MNNRIQINEQIYQPIDYFGQIIAYILGIFAEFKYKGFRMCINLKNTFKPTLSPINFYQIMPFWTLEDITHFSKLKKN